MGADLFEQRLASFLDAAQANITAYYQQHFQSLAALGRIPQLAIERGQRYIRIVKKEPGLTGGSVYCFIDTKPETLGNIYKAASYKAPAKHARGNIMADDNGAGGVGVWGAIYLR